MKAREWFATAAFLLGFGVMIFSAFQHLGPLRFSTAVGLALLSAFFAQTILRPEDCP